MAVTLDAFPDGASQIFVEHAEVEASASRRRPILFIRSDFAHWTDLRLVSRICG